MEISNVFISVTEGGRQLVIDGPLDLLKKFINTVVERTESPDPSPEPLTIPRGAIS